MSETLLPNEQANALSGSTDSTTGLTYPTALEDPWLAAFYRFGHRLNLIAQLANNLRPYQDDSDSTTIGVRPGRCTIDGSEISFAGGTVAELANNDVTYVWLEADNGAAQLGAGIDSDGWPSYPHVKLAEVTLAAGAISSIVDRRGSNMILAWPTYQPTIAVQGDTTAPTRVHITGAGQRDLLRVRVCDDGGYGMASSATIAPAGETTTVETHAAGTDLVLQSSDAGLFEIDMSNAAAETVTLRLGPSDLSPRMGDYSRTLQVVHAAP